MRTTSLSKLRKQSGSFEQDTVQYAEPIADTYHRSTQQTQLPVPTCLLTRATTTTYLLHETNDHPAHEQRAQRGRQAYRAVAHGAAQERKKENAASRHGSVAQRSQNQPPDYLGQAVGGR